jgi:ligand-binding SRPBCC domain-containing protein
MPAQEAWRISGEALSIQVPRETVWKFYARANLLTISRAIAA